MIGFGPIGKLAGVAGAIALGTWLRLGDLPEGVAMRHFAGMGALAGIGFTVSIFVTNLAFSAPALADQAKLGVLVASVCKLFSTKELVARVRAVLRRARGPLAPPGPGAPSVHADGDLEVDVAARQARLAGAVVSLTAREFGQSGA